MFLHPVFQAKLSLLPVYSVILISFTHFFLIISFGGFYLFLVSFSSMIFFALKNEPQNVMHVTVGPSNSIFNEVLHTTKRWQNLSIVYEGRIPLHFVETCFDQIKEISSSCATLLYNMKMKWKEGYLVSIS